MGGHSESRLRVEIEFPSDNTSYKTVGIANEIAGDLNGQYVSAHHLLWDSTPVGALPILGGVSSHFESMAMPLDRLKLWQFYDFSPDLMRKPTNVKQEHILNESGSNLSTVVHSLFSEGHPDLEEAIGMLQAMVPTVEGLRSPIFGDGQTYVALKEKGVEYPVGAWGLSDGTLLALALSIALVVRPEPELICVESPETGIHPQDAPSGSRYGRSSVAQYPSDSYHSVALSA